MQHIQSSGFKENDPCLADVKVDEIFHFVGNN